MWWEVSRSVWVSSPDHLPETKRWIGSGIQIVVPAPLELDSLHTNADIQPLAFGTGCETEALSLIAIRRLEITSGAGQIEDDGDSDRGRRRHTASERTSEEILWERAVSMLGSVAGWGTGVLPASSSSSSAVLRGRGAAPF